MPGSEPAACRLYSIPASLVGAFDDALGALADTRRWAVGGEAGAASVDDVTAAYKALIEAAWVGGCRMVGQVIEVAVNSIPSGCLPCDGTEYANADWPELAAVIHVGLRTDGAHFRTPDRNRRFALGGAIVGVQGGEETHALTEFEMPGHTHIEEGFGVAESVVLGELPGLSAAPAPKITGSTGGGGAHNNMPPYEGTIFVIVATSNG